MIIAFEKESRRPVEQEDELVLRLVVPETWLRAMTAGDDPLDFHSPAFGQDFGQFVGEPIRDPVEKISFQIVSPAMVPDQNHFK